jgi:hypothetical protein
MPIIYSYPIKGSPVTADSLVLTDSQDSNATKTVTIASVLALGGGSTTFYTAGDGLQLIGTEFSTDLKGESGLQITGGELDLDIKANGGVVIEVGEIAVDLSASSITGTLAIGDGGTGSSSTTYCDLTANVTGILPLANGGTGTSSTTYCNLTTNVTGTLPIANGGTGSTSTTYCNLASNVTGTLPVGNAGTGITSYTTGDIVYANSGSTLTKLGIGTASYVLVCNSTPNAPEWVDPRTVNPLIIQDEGVDVVTPNTTRINFVGSTITATAAGSVANVTIGDGGGGLEKVLAAGNTGTLATSSINLSHTTSAINLTTNTGTALSVAGESTLTGLITSGGGINFGNDTLSTYITNTWTPVISCVTPGTLSIGYASQTGKYTKIGNTVFANFKVTLNAFTAGTASGAVTIGLPVSSSTTYAGSVQIISSANITGGIIGGYIGSPGKDVATFKKYTNSTDFAISDTDITSSIGATTTIEGTMIYHTN